MYQRNRIHTLNFNCVIVIDFLIFPIALIIAFLPLCFWFCYYRIVKFLARIFHPDYIPLTGSDPLFSLDIFTKGPGAEGLPEVRQNIGWLIRVQVSPEDNNINLEWIQDKFTSSFLKNDENGRKEYPNFFAYPVRYGGYTFRKPVEFIQIHHHIYECELRKGESLEEFTSRWLSKPFPESSPVWEVALIRETGTAEENVIIFKINHSCADGYNLIHILDTLTDNQSPYLVKEFQETFWDKVKLLIQFPRVYSQFIANSFITGRRTAFSNLDRGKGFHDVMSFIDLDLSDLLSIRRKTESHFSSVIAAVIGGVVEKVLLEQAENEEKTKIPDSVQQFLSLPWPNHPRKEMCNHWTIGSVTAPLKSVNSLERLRAVERAFEDYHHKGLNKSSKRFLFNIFGILPSSLLKYLFERNPGQMGFTALVGSSRDYHLNGNPIRLIHPLIGTSFENIGLSSFCFSYSTHFNCTLIAKEPVVKLAQGMSRIQECFAQEVKCLQKLVLQKENERTVSISDISHP